MEPHVRSKLFFSYQSILLWSHLRYILCVPRSYQTLISRCKWDGPHFNAKFCVQVDWFGFMAYDLHGSWDSDVMTLGSIVRGQADIREIYNNTMPLVSGSCVTAPSPPRHVCWLSDSSGLPASIPKSLTLDSQYVPSLSCCELSHIRRWLYWNPFLRVQIEHLLTLYLSELWSRIYSSRP